MESSGVTGFSLKASVNALHLSAADADTRLFRTMRPPATKTKETRLSNSATRDLICT